MPKFNRRSFLHMIGAASLAPLVPAMPAKAAAGGGASHAQLLWAGLYKQAGSTSNFTRVTKGLGISTTTAHRIHAKLAGSRIVLAKGASGVRTAVRPAPRTMKAATKAEPSSKKALSDVRKLLKENTEDNATSPQDDTDQDDVIETSKTRPKT